MAKDVTPLELYQRAVTLGEQSVARAVRPAPGNRGLRFPVENEIHDDDWLASPAHEVLERLLASRRRPTKHHLLETEPSTPDQRYRQLARSYSPISDLRHVPYPRRELWNALGKIARGEILWLFERNAVPVVRDAARQIVEAVSAFPVPNYLEGERHFILNQLLLVEVGGATRKFALEIESQLSKRAERVEHIQSLGYDVLFVSQSWASFDAYRCIVEVLDVALGTSFMDAFLGPSCVEDYVCAACGERMNRPDVDTFRRVTERDLSSDDYSDLRLNDGVGFVHLECRLGATG